jgi:peptide deformylase
MAVREIITPANPALRQRARKVRSITPAVQELIDDMIETMRAAPGVGLAAPQIAVGQRVIVVEYAEPPEDGQAPAPAPRLYALVNPEIVRRSTETVAANEACLSVPGYFGEVERAQAVSLRALDRRGKPTRIKAEGWLARIFQHEIDHLDGILYTDRATRMWRVEEAEGQTVPAAD